jgi:NTE family protein
MHNLGIILSGGGARGYAHAGVLQALEEMGIFPDAVAGVSAGSIIGAAYASGMNASELCSFAESANLRKALFPQVSFSGLINLSYLGDYLMEHIPCSRLEDLPIPLTIGLSNLNTGDIELWSKGPLREAVMASCAIPLVFHPVEINGQIYVDGGLLMNFPVPALRDKCKRIIGVNLMPQVSLPREKLMGALSMTAIAIRSFYLAVINNSKPWLDQCDVLIEAPELYGYHPFRFRKKEEIRQIGYRATMDKKEALLNMSRQLFS